MQAIHALGKRAGVAINPATPASVLEEILPDVELVLVMTVNPGFGGQQFIASTLPKIRRVRKMIDSVPETSDLEVDGGIEPHTAPLVVEAGAARAGGRLGGLRGERRAGGGDGAAQGRRWGFRCDATRTRTSEGHAMITIRPRFSIAALMGFVFVFGVGLAAFRYPNKLWASFLFSIAIGAMVVGSLGPSFIADCPRNSGRVTRSAVGSTCS